MDWWNHHKALWRAGLTILLVDYLTVRELQVVQRLKGVEVEPQEFHYLLLWVLPLPWDAAWGPLTSRLTDCSDFLHSLPAWQPCQMQGHSLQPMKMGG